MTAQQASSTLSALGGYPTAGLMATNAANGGAVASVLVPQAQKNGERLSTADFGILPGSTSDVFGPARNAMPTGGVLYLPSAGAQGWQAPSYGTPEGMSFEADGPNIQANELLGEGSGTYTWGKAWAARLPHNNGNGATGYSMSVSTYGSGYPTNDQTVLAIKANKDIYNQSGVQAGGLGGIVMSVYNGSPSGSQSDTYAYNSYVGVGYASGFAVIAEEKIAEGCSNYSTNCYEDDVQKGIENSAPGGAHIGEQWAAGLGVHDTLFRTLGSVVGGDSSTAAYQQTGLTGRWKNLWINQLDNVTTLQITDTGSISQAGTTTRGAVHTHLAHEVTLAGYNTPQAIVLTTDQANNETTTDNIMSQLYKPVSAYVGITGHVSCTDYNGAYWDGLVSAVFTTSNSTLPYILKASNVQGTPNIAGNGAKWTPTFSVSSLSGATGPKLTIADSGSDTGGIGCTADLSINENN